MDNMLKARIQGIYCGLESILMDLEDISDVLDFITRGEQPKCKSPQDYLYR
jgi:hypothetical protein